MIGVDMVADVLMDTKRTMDRIERKETRALYRSGGYTRRTMRQMLSRRPPKTKKTKAKHAATRKPPYRHVGLMYNAVAFHVDHKSLTTTVGVGKRKFWDDRSLIRHRSLPEFLDEGGYKKYRPRDPKTGDFTGRPRAVKYRPHPYLEKSRKKGLDFLFRLLKEQGVT